MSEEPKKQLPTTPSPKVPPTPTKVVTFTQRDNRWEVEVECKDNAFFTDRDFNQLSILLTIRRQDIRRKAALKYAENQRKRAQALKVEPKPTTH